MSRDGARKQGCLLGQIFTWKSISTKRYLSSGLQSCGLSPPYTMLCLTKSLVTNCGAVLPEGQNSTTGIKLTATQRGQSEVAWHFATLRLREFLHTYPWPQFHYCHKKYLSSKTNITSLQLCWNVFIKDHFSYNGEMLSQREWNILPEIVAFLAGFTRSCLIYFILYLIPPTHKNHIILHSQPVTPLWEQPVFSPQSSAQRSISRTVKGKEQKEEGKHHSIFWEVIKTEVKEFFGLSDIT